VPCLLSYLGGRELQISRSKASNLPVPISFSECLLRTSRCGSRTNSRVPPGPTDGATRMASPGYTNPMSQCMLRCANTWPKESIQVLEKIERVRWSLSAGKFFGAVKLPEHSIKLTQSRIVLKTGLGAIYDLVFI
jgi:hypothetical protein